MAEFSELVKNFDKIRDYMRDFFVYGFKARNDFTQKSSRTYDNEKRRIESYLGEYIKWDTSKGSKRVFISLDSSKITQNPLYTIWKSKSFTSKDIMLHFYLLGILSKENCLNIEELNDELCDKYGLCLDSQIVRIKANEYVKEGLLVAVKTGKTLCYSLSKDYLYKTNDNYEDILDAIKYFQEVAPFGVIGSYLLDNEDTKNDIFTFKHHFIVHTLEDKILLEIMKAMKEKSKIRFVNQSTRLGNIRTLYGIPLKIFVSTQSGRRYVSVYNVDRNRFINHRLDYIKSVEVLEPFETYDYLKDKLKGNLINCWGVSFGGVTRGEKVSVKLYIDEEKETHIINRLKREGRGGEVERVAKNIYLYSKELFDMNEAMSWVKSFTGRIISVEGSSKFVVDKFYTDMKRMQEIYMGGDDK
ncbi:MAG: WYL domain-containing protein [Clostridiaceae bacterium]|nr:WYL domain-containing protein [Clostridiaceae bacterium]